MAESDFEHALRIMDERDVLYKEMFRAQKELTSQAFTASERALSKAESALESYKTASNEWRGTLNDQAQTMLPRGEAELRFKGIEGDIRTLRESRSEGSGKESAAGENRLDAHWKIGIAVAIGLSFLGTAMNIIGMVKK